MRYLKRQDCFSQTISASAGSLRDGLVISWRIQLWPDILQGYLHLFESLSFSDARKIIPGTKGANFESQGVFRATVTFLKLP